MLTKRFRVTWYELIHVLIENFISIKEPLLKAYSWLTFTLVRTMASTADCTLEVYAPEVYPTYFRNAGVSMVRVGERLGTILAAYVAQLLFEANFRAALSVLVLFALTSSIFALLLPYETVNSELRDVKDNIEDECQKKLLSGD